MRGAGHFKKPQRPRQKSTRMSARSELSNRHISGSNVDFGSDEHMRRGLRNN